MSSAASEPVLIGLDWGTSSARAYLIGGHGDVLDSVSTDRGIMQIVGREFESACGELLARWRDLVGMPVVASGMITSRQGWIETPYLPLPAGSDALAHALVAHRTASGIELHFVGGLVTQANGAPDVIRGEETQIVGAVAAGLGDGVFVMPGTHSK